MTVADRSGGGETANEQHKRLANACGSKPFDSQSRNRFYTTAMYALLVGFGFGLFAAGSRAYRRGAGGVLREPLCGGFLLLFAVL